MDLENLSVKELEALLQQEQLKGKNLRNKIKTKMLKISVEMKRYNISTGEPNTVNYTKNIKRQLIAKIRSAQSYNKTLAKQWDAIKDTTTINALNAILLGYDNITVSKQVEMLRNIGYSEEEIDIILSEIRGDEDYEELKDKADTIITNHYIEEGGVIVGDDYIPPNPYAF